MADTSSSEQSRRHNIAHMGEELGELYSALWQQLTWLHRKWGDYVALFGTKPERIEILNKAAPDFFGNVQTALWEDALLHLARITDSPRSAGKRNLSFRGLPDLIERQEVKQSAEHLLEQALLATDFARDWRNRRIAHRDLSLALERSTEPLMPASRTSVNEALHALDEVLNTIAQAYIDTTTMFKFAQDPIAGGSISMLHYLRAGLREEEERRARILSGNFSEKDIDKEPI